MGAPASGVGSVLLLNAYAATLVVLRGRLWGGDGPPADAHQHRTLVGSRPRRARPRRRGGLPARSWLGVAVALVLAAFGVYLGRYLRLNSWDVWHPSSLLGTLSSHFRTAGSRASAGGFVVAHSLSPALVHVPVFSLAYASLVR